MVKLKDLTPEQKTRLLAELDGWAHLYEHAMTDSLHCHYRLWFGMNPKGEHDLRVPSYPTSYDAIIPLVQKVYPTLSNSMQNLFFQHIEHILKLDDCTGWDVLSATPSQLCDAVLVATGKAEL
jgi:hypothetical protein